jgi:hypothetical protein
MVMTNQQKSILDVETEQSLDAQCLVLELSGQTWYVPFDTLPVIPRVGEIIRLTGGSAGQVAEVEYEFAPEAAPVRVAREMPAGVSYARPVRIVIRLS